MNLGPEELRLLKQQFSKQQQQQAVQPVVSVAAQPTGQVSQSGRFRVVSGATAGQQVVQLPSGVLPQVGLFLFWFWLGEGDGYFLVAPLAYLQTGCSYFLGFSFFTC